MAQTDYVLEAQDLSKAYGSVIALENVNMSFAEQGIYGLFGRNGAGKTTLLDIITSRRYADRGSVICFGEDTTRTPKALTKHCCYMPEKDYFPGRLTSKKLLSFGKIAFPGFDESYAQRLCHRFKLNQNQKFGQLSKGYQSILKIILGLAARSPITIFDEPVLGLDAAGRDMFYLELIEEYSNSPRLFIISTHLIEESSDLFNEAIIIKNGEVVVQAPIEDLISKAFYVSGRTDRVNAFLQNRKVLRWEIVNEFKTAVVEGELDSIDQQTGLSFSPITIQKLFIDLTRGSEDEEASNE
ncbi:ATP-binding cassette domain-containing protein [Thermodesulfobacteriota bacterium]